MKKCDWSAAKGRCSHGYFRASTMRGLAILAVVLCCACQVRAGDIKVLKMGLGFGTVEIVSGATNALRCGLDCDGAYTDNVEVRLRATPAPGSTFLGWLGSVPGGPGPSPTSPGELVFTRNGNLSIRPVFGVVGWNPSTVPTDTLTEAQVNPRDIQTFLAAHPEVNSAARFIRALPRKYRMNWLLMTRSESLQTGTARYPRILLPSPDAKNVFSIGLARHASFPGSSPLAIEYMQWNGADKNFHFHEVILDTIKPMGLLEGRPRRDASGQKVLVEVDDAKCFQCHSTRNVLNRSPYPGTTGVTPMLPPNEIAKSKSKPNWDAYDSWAGMMPFNRDRIYQGSAEARAYKAIFNLWNWRDSPLEDSIRQVLEQLYLQAPYVPATSVHSIVRDTNETEDAQHIRFGFDRRSPGLPLNLPPSAAERDAATVYSFGSGASGSPNLRQGGRYLTIRHTNFGGATTNDSLEAPPSDEGRAVVFFDLLGGLKGGLNQLRVADEVESHRYATGSHPIDVRAIALAIATGKIGISGGTAVSLVPGVPLAYDATFFDARNGMSLALLYENTMQRTKSLPRRKADLQRANLDRTWADGADMDSDPERDIYLRSGDATQGIYQEYFAGTTPTLEQVRQEVFRRPIDIGSASDSIPGGVYVDREFYSNSTKMALFRYFLEPLGVSVDKWSMGVRGRSRLYAFADVFATYTDTLDSVLSRSLRSMTMDPENDTALIEAANAALTFSIDRNEIPKFTDVQRVFNKACIECHGGLDYPPYFGRGTSGIDFSENEKATGRARPGGLIDDRMYRSYNWANTLYSSILLRIERTSERIPDGMMPYGGPALSKCDVETIRRWVNAPGMRPYSVGDPHLMTVNGVAYDFQAVGEFVLLRGDYVEIQTRQTAISAAPLGPDAHTGLTTCVSLNTAVALHVFGHRITYQPSPDNPRNLILRVDGAPVPYAELPRAIGPSARIVQSTAENGIKIEGPGGSGIFITPGFWEHYNLSFFSVDVHLLRAAEGLMGTVHPGEWLPALPDGTRLGPIPSDLGARYKILYGVFAERWRVSDSTSLFDYAPGQSTDDFTLRNWPNGESPKGCNLPAEPGEPKPLPPMERALAEQRCADITDPVRRALCVMDLVATGDPIFAENYLATDKINRNRSPKVPQLKFPASYQTGVRLPIKFAWDPAIDEDGDPVSYRVLVWPIKEFPDNNKAVEVGGKSGGGWGGNRCLWIILGVALVLLVALYLLLRKRKGLFAVLALLVVIAAIVAIVLCRQRGAGAAPELLVEELPAGEKSFYWKVIAEDGNGGLTESDMQRFELE